MKKSQAHAYYVVMSEDNEPIQVTILKPMGGVITKTGNPNGILVVCNLRVEQKDYRGYSVCHPSDEFDLRFGTKLALERALDSLPTTYTIIMHGWSEGIVDRHWILSKFDRKKIWDEFNRIFPPQ